ncbi:MAG TPA: RNA chaperone Hfq [Thermoanaerobaculia bacterium]|nr:RNA chaperone Hfq [Thermoanaerobaculia bacterium]
MIAKPAINVQDGYFYQLRKENTVVEITLLPGNKRTGRIRRFDRYAVVVEVDGREELIYKHAIASITTTGAPVAAMPAVAARPSGA